MPDHYKARIRAWPWPDDTRRIQAAVDWVSEQFGQIVAVEPAQKVPMFTPQVDRDGMFLLEVEEACQGIDEFLERGLGADGGQSFVEILRDAEISFVAIDDGAWGHQGREVSWTPGLHEIRKRAVLPGDEVALPAHLALSFLAGGSPTDVGHRVRNYFAALTEFTEIQ